jgi:hypothetical protein
MFRPLLLAALLLSLPGLSLPAWAGEKKVWRIDSLIATQKNGVITVEAKGAVQSGGWTNPRLKLVHNDAHGASFEFVAAAPPAGMTVIDVMVPVTATVQVHGRAPAVRAAAEANDMTTQVLH